MSDAPRRFSNPAGAAREDADRYVAALLALLGDRDPLSVLAGTPDALERAAAGLDDAAARVPEAPGRWSAVQVVRHLADSEIVYGYRLRKIVAEPGGVIEGYDQDRWAVSLRYGDARIAEALEDFRALRAVNLRWLRGLAGDEPDREGIHAERGPESVRHVLRLLAAHDLVHLAQLRRIREATGL